MRFGYRYGMTDFGREYRLTLIVEHPSDGFYAIEFDRHLKARQAQSDADPQSAREAAFLLESSEGDFVRMIVTLRGKGYEFVPDIDWVKFLTHGPKV